MRFCLRGVRTQCLIALEDRLLIVKRGVRAGATFGRLTTTIYYADVQAVVVRSGLRTVWIELAAAPFQPRERRRLLVPDSTKRNRNLEANCLPLRRSQLRDCRLQLDQLELLIAAAKKHAAGGAEPPLAGVLDEVERLADLVLAGKLSRSDFDLAKRALLLRDRNAA